MPLEKKTNFSHLQKVYVTFQGQRHNFVLNRIEEYLEIYCDDSNIKLYFWAYEDLNRFVNEEKRLITLERFWKNLGMTSFFELPKISPCQKLISLDEIFDFYQILGKLEFQKKVFNG